MTKQLLVFLLVVIVLVCGLYYWHINSGNPYDAKAFFGQWTMLMPLIS